MRYVILQNIRSRHNVGSVFRTADGAGISKIFLVGYTPTPVDRFGRLDEEIKKTSLGATESVAWEYREDAELLIEELQQKNVEVVSIEQSERSRQLKEYQEPADVAYVFGNEIEGVSPEVLAMSDEVLLIPMQGKKESLNVSVCVGIVLFKSLIA